MFADDVDRQRFVQARLGVHFRLVIRPDGSIFVPAEVAASFGVGPGDILMGHISGDDFNLVSGQTALRRAQEAVRKMIPPGVNLADELIADRRREAEREEADD
jgi:bifunctional DNA-binding transcriptional regulator/antitoxin component of YhaV-PrlF toxin-antitoxin module